MLTSCIDERTGQGNLVTCSPSTLPLFRSIEKNCLLIVKNNKWLHSMKNFLRLFSGQHHLLYFTLYKLLRAYILLVGDFLMGCVTSATHQVVGLFDITVHSQSKLILQT